MTVPEEPESNLPTGQDDPRPETPEPDAVQQENPRPPAAPHPENLEQAQTMRSIRTGEIEEQW